MTVKDITIISDHADLAIGRLTQIYKDPVKQYSVSWSPDLKSGWEVMIHAFAIPSQSLEDVMASMLADRALDTAEGVNLDRIGQIVGQDRKGLSDIDYLTQIQAQIAENNSDGTGNNILNIASLILGPIAKFLSIKEMFPAKVVLDVGVIDTSHLVVTEENNELTIYEGSVIPDAYDWDLTLPNSQGKRITVTTNATDTSIKFSLNSTVDDTQALAFAADLTANYLVVGGVLSMVDKNLAVWTMTSLFTGGQTLVVSGGTLTLKLVESSVDLCTMTKNTVSVPVSDIGITDPVWYGAPPVDYFSFEDPLFANNNPNGLLKGIPPSGDFDNPFLLTLATGTVSVEVLSASITDAFLAQFGLTVPVTFDVETGSFTLELTGSAGAIVFGSAASLYGFESFGFASNDTVIGWAVIDEFGDTVGGGLYDTFGQGSFLSGDVTGIPVSGVIKEDITLIKEAILGAKVAGVELAIEIVLDGNYFGMDSDAEAIGFGSLVDGVVIGGGNYASLNL